MIEQSVLQQAEVADLLASRFGLGSVEAIRLLPGGSANCWHVHVDDGQYLLKEFQSSDGLDDVRVEPELNDFLRSCGVPASTFVRTRAGEFVWSDRGRVFHLQHYIDGHIHLRNACPYWLVTEVQADDPGCLQRTEASPPYQRNVPDRFRSTE